MRFFMIVTTFLGVCSMSLMVHAESDAGWFKVEESGEIKATIDLRSITHNPDGNAYARICIYKNGICPEGFTERWFINCHNDYSSVAGVFSLVYADPRSPAAQLSAIACNPINRQQQTDKARPKIKWQW
jgi:hypothetical protein